MGILFFSYLYVMKITILGPAHPYRGGLASIMQTMARVYQHEGHEVDLCTDDAPFLEFLEEVHVMFYCKPWEPYENAYIL